MLSYVIVNAVIIWILTPNMIIRNKPFDFSEQLTVIKLEW